MATFFRNALVKEIGTTVTDVVTVAGNARVTVIGFSLANITDFIVKADVEIVAGDNSTAYFSKNLIIPPNSSARIVNGGEKLILKQADVVKIKANVDDALDAVVSYVEIV